MHQHEPRNQLIAKPSVEKRQKNVEKTQKAARSGFPRVGSSPAVFRCNIVRRVIARKQARPGFSRVGSSPTGFRCNIVRRVVARKHGTKFKPQEGPPKMTIKKSPALTRATTSSWNFATSAQSSPPVSRPSAGGVTRFRRNDEVKDDGEGDAGEEEGETFRRLLLRIIAEEEEEEDVDA